MSDETLMEKTRRLLHDSGRSLPAVYADMRNDGSDITFYWLRKFSSGTIKDPSVNRVEELYRHLTGQSLTRAS
jgi:hypothetical protein